MSNSERSGSADLDANFTPYDFLQSALRTKKEVDRERDDLYAAAQRKGARCKECALYRTKTPRGPVPSTIKRPAKLVVIGDSPGNKEVGTGVPFRGAVGDKLELGLYSGGLHREDCTITNALLCQPDLDGGSIGDYLEFLKRNPKKTEDGSIAIDPRIACAPRLRTEIVESGATTLLAVGGTSLEMLCKLYGLNYGKGEDRTDGITVASIRNQHGSPIVLDDTHQIEGVHTATICTSLNPAFAMRGNKAYAPVIQNDIARAAAIALKDGHVDWQMPTQVQTFPDFVDLVAELELFWLRAKEVTVDIESDSADQIDCNIRCIGLGAEIGGQERVIVVPLRWMDGRAYWSNAQLLYDLEEMLRELFDSIPIVAHNGIFDTGVLIRAGLMTAKKALWFDTMIADHDTHANDLPHKLGDVARRYFPVPLWKKDVDHKGSGSVGEDRALHEYNVMDVVTTMRLAPALRSTIASCGTQPQFRTDTSLAPVSREMTSLGLFINEHRRGQLSRRLNKLCNDLQQGFADLVGRDINPRSTKQLSRWLFDEQGITPPLNPDGYEWNEGDAASTSAPAITKILDDPALPAEVRNALNTLLEYKSYEKLRSTYVDNLRVKNNVGGVPTIDACGALPSRPLLSRLHPSWKIHIIPTGRWASSPNAQNWPSRTRIGNMRQLVVAPPGHCIVGADYEQIELRIYAVMANDRLLLDAFRNDMDPHTLNAATLMSKLGTESDIMRLYEQYMGWKAHGTKEEKNRVKYIRTVAKRFAFLECYGGEEDKLYAVMSSERDKVSGRLVFKDLKPADCESWHDRWHTAHPETRAWHQQCAEFQRQHKYISAIGDGRKRFFLGGVDKKNAVPNMQIQGTAGWIANQATLRLAEAIPFEGWSPYTGLCLQVHDYLGAFVPMERAEEAQGLFRECMYHEHEGMPFPVDTPLATWDWAAQG